MARAWSSGGGRPSAASSRADKRRRELSDAKCLTSLKDLAAVAPRAKRQLTIKKKARSKKAAKTNRHIQAINAELVLAKKGLTLQQLCSALGRKGMKQRAMVQKALRRGVATGASTLELNTATHASSC